MVTKIIFVAGCCLVVSGVILLVQYARERRGG